jgi:hypothetical protein
VEPWLNSYSQLQSGMSSNDELQNAEMSKEIRMTKQPELYRFEFGPAVLTDPGVPIRGTGLFTLPRSRVAKAHE